MARRWIHKAIAFVLFLVGFNFCEHFCHQKTDGFSLHRIRFSRASDASSHSPLDPAISSLLKQPFHYLDCGNQCFVFISDDGRYVLKFFKYAQPTVPRFLTTIPLLNRFKPFRPHRFEKVMEKQQRDLQGYQLAFSRFKEETGLVAVHLHPSEPRYPTVTLTDKLHIIHQIDLNTAPFILQRKASPVYSQLKKWVAAGDIQQAKQGIQSLILLLQKRIHKELQDDDVHFYSNFGFMGSTAIQIDPGHFTLGSSAHPEAELQTLLQPLIRWCEKYAPSLLPLQAYETSSS